MRKPNNFLIIYDETTKTSRISPIKNKRAVLKAILEAIKLEHNIRITSTLFEEDV